jgi:cell fate regulator YaaT (PSP1 superfamily)
MERVIGVRFQEAGKVYYFSPVGFEDVEVGEYVVVETSRGLEIARVVIAPGQVVLAELTEPLKPITRMALAEDIERAEQLKRKANDDLAVARQLARERELPMKIVSANYNLDGTRLTIYFTSEGRVDFRDFLRDLSQRLRTQVQLRPVGPRDQAKAVDGYGRCGRRLCCSSWLTSFPTISIKMAKEQDLPLNPAKISGLCGRLLCCLAYEDDTYKQLKAQLPKPGTLVSTPGGSAKVLAVNALKQVVTLQMETLEVVELPATALGIDRGVVRVITPPAAGTTGTAPGSPIAVAPPPPPLMPPAPARAPAAAPPPPRAEGRAQPAAPAPPPPTSESTAKRRGRRTRRGRRRGGKGQSGG